jgi:uncharacterized membrane protein
MNKRVKYATQFTAAFFAMAIGFFALIYVVGIFFLWAPAWLGSTVAGVGLVAVIWAVAWSSYKERP